MTDVFTWRIDPDAPHDIVDEKADLVASFYAPGNPREYTDELWNIAYANAAFALRAIQAHEEFVAAAKKFCAKVDSGRARSSETYADMIAALALAEKP